MTGFLSWLRQLICFHGPFVGDPTEFHGDECARCGKRGVHKERWT